MHLKKVIVHIFALLLCSVIPAILFLLSGLFAGPLESLSATLWYQFLEMFALITYVAALHAVGLGLPIYWLVTYYSAFTYRASLLCGFIAGSLPIAIYMWPLDIFGPKGSTSIQGVKTVIDGIPTLSGWLFYIKSVCVFGFLGSSGALMFKYVLNKFSPQESQN